MSPSVFITEAWSCAPSDGTVHTLEANACISLAAVTGAELTAAAFTDGTTWSDGAYFSDYPYFEIVAEDEAA